MTGLKTEQILKLHNLSTANRETFETDLSKFLA